jgi:hypothetical protein
LTVKFIAVTIAFPSTLPRFFLGGGAHDDQVREMLKGRKISPLGSACVPQAAFGILPDAGFLE